MATGRKTTKKAEAPREVKFARLDHDRAERCGFPEFVYGAGKSADQLCAIIAELKKHATPILCTRVDAAKAAKVKTVHPELTYCAVSEVLYHNEPPLPAKKFKVVIAAAGTSDLKVALEAQHTANLGGVQTELLCDVGVAGIHRLFERVEDLRRADAIIAIAGMEGALPSVIGGLVSCPVIAVPTSVGYGVSAGGFAALAGMLSSCASGMTVVNIDNGFGAACAVLRLSTLLDRRLRD